MINFVILKPKYNFPEVETQIYCFVLKGNKDSSYSGYTHLRSWEFIWEQGVTYTSVRAEHELWLRDEWDRGQ